MYLKTKSVKISPALEHDTMHEYHHNYYDQQQRRLRRFSISVSILCVLLTILMLYFMLFDDNSFKRRIFLAFSSTKNFPRQKEMCETSAVQSGMSNETDARYWYCLAEKKIRFRRDESRPIEKRAKNVIFFLGDGMGISTITASRILKGQLRGQSGEESELEFDRFPYTALIKTYNLDKQVPDSAGTATAYLTGVKGNYGTLGVSGLVNRETTDCQLVTRSSVTSILQWALEAGKAAGIVTTTRITHATPAAGYAHSQNRKWEGAIANGTKGEGCKDIARQLVEDFPGNKLNVVLGGGRMYFLPEDHLDPTSSNEKELKGKRTDGKNLIADWKKMQASKGLSPSEYAFVNSTETLRLALEQEKVKYLLGLFDHSHMSYEHERDRSPNGQPSLSDMTQAALQMLTKNKNGFVLLVEGGRIDHGHHAGKANTALHETVEFDRAIRRARMMLPDDEETLILVSADHSHTLTINGNADRGNDIRGIAGNDEDGQPFTTLMYTNGPGYRRPKARSRLNKGNTADIDFQFQAAVQRKSARHAGEDVAIFAKGPMAHYFTGTHEQSYIAHVIGFAACIGQYSEEEHC